MVAYACLLGRVHMRLRFNARFASALLRCVYSDAYDTPEFPAHTSETEVLMSTRVLSLTSSCKWTVRSCCASQSRPVLLLASATIELVTRHMRVEVIRIV